MLVVYLLAAFALRRRGLGRRELRPSRTTVSPSFVPPAAMRALSHLRARLVGGDRIESRIKGRLAIAYR